MDSGELGIKGFLSCWLAACLVKIFSLAVLMMRAGKFWKSY